MDLISRQAAIDAVEKESQVDDAYGYMDTKSIVDLLSDLPPAEPKTGKWVDIVEMDSGGYPFKVGLCCSVCGAPTLSDDNYCPHCGAKMEVEE